MIKCPSCGRPVSGRPTVCGYCGHSLVQSYFSRPPEQKKPAPSKVGGSCFVSATLGGLGALALLGALVFFLLPLFSKQGAPGLETLPPDWWVCVLLLAVLSPMHLSAQITTHGRHNSLLYDGFWLFAGSFALGFLAQAQFLQTAPILTDVTMGTYLFTLGAILVSIGSLIGILGFYYE